MKRARKAAATPLSVGDVIDHVLPRADESVLLWPPDVFAICGAILQRSGAYLAVVDDWPPHVQPEGWIESIQQSGSNWRIAAAHQTPTMVPAEVAKWWKTVVSASTRGIAIEELRKHHDTVAAMAQLVAAADEACRGIGLIVGDKDEFDQRANALFFASGQTLCSSAVDSSRAIVLPKLHTPQLGITLRSLTHHLALYIPGEVQPLWKMHPLGRAARTDDFFRLLLLPWPMQIDPASFEESEGRLRNMPRDSFGFFRYRERTNALDYNRLLALFEKAGQQCGPIDGIVFPELSLRQREAEAVAAMTNTFVVGGYGIEPTKSDAGRNYAVMALPLQNSIAVAVQQSKHHRWKLNKNQIDQYALALDAQKQWWEHIAIGPRELNFVTMSNWLTVSFLICEDLARLDPVTHLLHSVGPTLIICLLMDGPQLAARWPSRYATVLADDPGSSVLTLTSLGMALASRVPDKPPSRKVALWKDALDGTPTEIELDEGCSGVVLTLRRIEQPEWTADGRCDRTNTSFLKYETHVSV